MIQSHVSGSYIKGIYLLFAHNNPLNGLKEALPLPPLLGNPAPASARTDESVSFESQRQPKPSISSFSRF